MYIIYDSNGCEVWRTSNKQYAEDFKKSYESHNLKPVSIQYQEDDEVGNSRTFLDYECGLAAKSKKCNKKSVSGQLSLFGN